MRSWLLVVVGIFLSFDALAGFRAYQGTSDLKLYSILKCSTGLTCSREADKLLMKAAASLSSDGSGSIVGYKQNQVSLATATTLTVAQCGSTVVNSAALVATLPKASIGCRFTFITANASNFDINPNDADRILVSTDATGDAIRNATLGNSITLEAISATQWAPVAIQGTWSDIN